MVSTIVESDGERGVIIGGDEVIFHDDGAIFGAGLPGGEIDFWVAFEVTGSPRESSLSEIPSAFSGVAHEDIVGEGDILGLIEPAATSAIAEGIAGDGDVAGRAFDAHDAGAVGAVNFVVGDGDICAIFGDEEGSHTSPSDAVIGEADVLGAEDVHGIAGCAEAALVDVDVLASRQVKRTFAGTGAGG